MWHKVSIDAARATEQISYLKWACRTRQSKQEINRYNRRGKIKKECEKDMSYEVRKWKERGRWENNFILEGRN